MKTVCERLFALREEQYAAFQSRLMPTIDPDLVIGVRMPLLRKYAAELDRTPQKAAFLRELPHTYYEENLLHGALLSRMKDFHACVTAVDEFLPYVDNWAVCDTFSPAVFGRHREELLGWVKKWIASRHPYVCRYGVGMLMRHYLGDAFQPEYLELPGRIESGEYYVNMMVAWFFATALAKQWETTIPYLEQRKLPAWTHAKTIRKAIESYRITDEQKTYLRSLLYSTEGKN